MQHCNIGRYVTICRRSRISASVKGFGRRPLAGRPCVVRGRRPKASQGGNRGQEGGPFGRARPMEILGSRTARVCRRGGLWRAILAAETMMTSESGREDARPWRRRGGRGRTDDLERTSASLGSAQRRKRGVESGSCGERGEIAEEGETAGLVQRVEAFEKKTAEQAREDAHGEEEAGPASDPTFAVQRKAAARNDNVDVRMMGERRAPGVQHGGEADVRAQMLRVGGDGGQRLGGGPEQEVVDGRLVLERDGADRSRQGEDDMTVGNLQKLGLTLGEPLPRRRPLTLRAVAVAAGNGRRPLPALWAHSVMGSWRVGISNFAVNCSGLSLHNSTVLRVRRLGHQWPITNGDEPVGDLPLGIEDAGASTERAKQQRTLATS